MKLNLFNFNLAEKAITYFARKRNARCLQFGPSTSFSITPSAGNAPIFLYIHVPFCEELCPYCSFNRVEFQETLARSYFKALRKEILMYKNLGYNFKSLYIGGGTPTILIDELETTINLIKKMYGVTEISVETNPNHLIKQKLDILKNIGVNRLSVGVQTFNDALLKAINRYHKYGSGQETAERLKNTQGIFDTLNVDMIFNFPSQTREMLENDLYLLLESGVDQITYYPLMASSQTQEKMNKEFAEDDANKQRDYYIKIAELLSSQYKTVSAWCFSKKNTKTIDEYIVNFDEYVGLGSGSISYLEGSAYANIFDIESYIAKVENGMLPITAKKDFSIKEKLYYDFLMKLFGLNLDISQLKTKHRVNVYRYLLLEILFFRLINSLEKRGNILSLTEKGKYYWVLMMREFFTGVNNFRDYCRTQINNNKNST